MGQLRGAEITLRSGLTRRAVTAVALACALGAAAATPALAVENSSSRYYTAEGTADEYGGPSLRWSGPAGYGPGQTGDAGDEAFALGDGHLAVADPSDGNFGTRAFTLRFSARFTGDGGPDEQVLSKRESCGDGSFLDVRTRNGQVYAELQGSGQRATVLHPAAVHDGDWHVVTIGRTGSALSVTVDGDTATDRSGDVADLGNSAPLRFGGGPCVGEGVAAADVLLDDISYGTGLLPVERPVAPGLPIGQPSVASLLEAPSAIIDSVAIGEGDDSEAAGTTERDAAGSDSSSAGDAAVGGSEAAEGSAADDSAADGQPLAAGSEAPASNPQRAQAVAYPADSGAGSGIAAAVLPGAGDAEAGTGLDWTGALDRSSLLTEQDRGARQRTPSEPRPASPAPAERPEPPLTLPAPAAPTGPQAQGLVAPATPAPLSGPDAYERGTAAVAFSEALRPPSDVRWDLGAIAQSLLITLVLLALAALPAGVVNSTAEANAGRIGAALARMRVPAVLAWCERVPLAGAVSALAVLGAVVYGLLEPSFWFDESSLALVVGLALAFLVITVAQQVPRSAYMEQWWGIPGRLMPSPGFLLLGVACVLVSRLVGLEPGLILGTLVVFRTAKPLRDDEKGPAVAVSAAILILVGLLAWMFRDVVVTESGSVGAFLPEVLDGALTAIAVAAVANVAIMLVPLGSMDGAAVLRWSKAAWAVLAGVGAFAFVHVLLGTSSGPGALAGRGTFLAVLAGVYLLGVAGFWAWFRYREPATVPARKRELVG